MNARHWVLSGSIGLGISVLACPAFAQGNGGYGYACAGLPSQATLQSALDGAIGGNGGLGFNMWATIVANDGTVCAVAFSGAQYTSQWLGSRLISAQKANTANDFSLGTGAPPSGSAFPNGLALSTANLYSAVQPGGSLYGLQHSNPVDPEIAYFGNAMLFGTAHDPLVGQRVGGVNVFGGGLALYSLGTSGSGGIKVGGLGVSGDTSCTDHFVAWKVRHTLGLDHFGLVGGVSGDTAHPDNIIYDITVNAYGVGEIGVSAGGFGHPTCSPATPAPSSLVAVQRP
jgi:Haem-degrading